jgi:hypothetical protein
MLLTQKSGAMCRMWAPKLPDREWPLALAPREPNHLAASATHEGYSDTIPAQVDQFSKPHIRVLSDVYGVRLIPKATA